MFLSAGHWVQAGAMASGANQMTLYPEDVARDTCVTELPCYVELRHGAVSGYAKTHTKVVLDHVNSGCSPSPDADAKNLACNTVSRKQMIALLRSCIE